MLSSEQKQALKALVEKFELEEQDTRVRIRKEIELGECMWNGQHNVYWDSKVNKWYTPRDAFEFGYETDADLLDYDKYINTYRAHGKSIIAASSIEFPKYLFLPENFSDPVDILTSEVYSKVAGIIQHQNNGRRLFARAFWIRWTQHFIAIYNYNKSDPKFGMVPIEEEVEINEAVPAAQCTRCGATTDLTDGQPCMSCGSPDMTPTTMDTIKKEKQVVGEEPQHREIIEVFGPKHVRIPLHVKNFEDTPYLCLAQDFHYSRAKAELGRIAELKDVYNLRDEEEELRLPEYDVNRSTVTISQYWVRPWAFYTLENGAEKELLKQFPSGARIIFLNQEPALAFEENIDDHWTLSISSTSDSIHDDPLGKDLIPLNMIQDELLQQTLETIKQAIPEMFADPSTVDFKTYGTVEKRPGTVIPAQPRAGQNMDASFYESKPATLSKEVDVFADKLQQLMQLVVHAFPSIFGGQMQGSSGTYAEYAKSAQQALQVLALDYTPVVDAFGASMKKSVKSFLENLVGDQLNYSYAEKGSKINIFIDKTTVSGKIGDVTLESAAQIPLSWAELRAMVIETIQGGNPQLISTLFHPENTTYVKSILGLQQLYVPGEPDRKKQLMEIEELINSDAGEDNQIDPIMQRVMGPKMIPSIPVSDSDNHQIHIETITIWEISEAGEYAKKNNPQGFQNVMLHKQMHQASLAPPMPAMPPPGSPESQQPKPPQGQSQGPVPGPMNPKGGAM